MGIISTTEIVIGAIIGIMLQYIVIKIERWLSSKSKPMHGTWYEVLPSFQGLPERIDKISLTQKGNLVNGKAYRIYPKEEKQRKWKFHGYVNGNKLIGFFYILDTGIDPSSYIPIIMVRDKQSRHEAIWKGIYYRPEFEDEQQIIDGNLDTGAMWWQRSKPDMKVHPQLLEEKSEQIKISKKE